METETASKPDYELLKRLDRVIVMMMVAILLVLTLPVMQATSAPRTAGAMPQIQLVSPVQHKPGDPFMLG